MTLAQIHAMARTLDDAGRSPAADLAAAAWGLAPGTARHRRSSASHVFAAAHPRLGPVYLRLIPDGCRPRDEVLEVARLMRALAERALPVVRPLASDAGALVETVATPLGGLHATLVGAAPGAQIEADDLTPGRAGRWGAALALLHRDGAAPHVRLPEPFAQLPRVAELFQADPAFAAAAEDIARRLEHLPRDPDCFGLAHGDFELDNMCWDGDGATAFDFDEAARSWFAADLAYAVRDLAPVPARTPRPGEADLFGAFLAGYRRVRALPEPELARLPLFEAAHAACSAVRVRSALDDAGRPDDPPWLRTLRGKLERHIERQRDAAVAFAEGSARA
ncbi:MAG TPA: phosphotransferase [Actinocrinis sp.]|nr:phosphotransferase [Actinocrinis sp.]